QAGANALPYAVPALTLGITRLQLEKYAEAEPPLRAALAVLHKRQPNAWTTAQACSLLGGALAGQQKYGEAELLLRKGDEGLKERQGAIPPGARGVVAEALTRLVRLYEATGQEDRAEAYRKELDRLRNPSP